MHGMIGLKFTALAFLGTTVIAGPANSIPLHAPSAIDLTNGGTYIGSGASIGTHSLVADTSGGEQADVTVNAGAPSPFTIMLTNMTRFGSQTRTDIGLAQQFAFSPTSSRQYASNSAGSVALGQTTATPPALILFGTGLIGLSWLGLRRR
jgi:hypothetical protein